MEYAQYGTTDTVEPIELPDIEDNEEVDDEQDSSESETTTSSSGRNSAKNNRAAYRRVAAKTVEVLDADENARALAAALLGSATDPVELTTAIMTAGRGATSALADVANIAQVIKEKPLRAGIIAAALERSAMRNVWNVLVKLGALKGNPPQSAAKAGLSVAEAISELTDANTASLEAADTLVKRN